MGHDPRKAFRRTVWALGGGAAIGALLAAAVGLATFAHASPETASPAQPAKTAAAPATSATVRVAAADDYSAAWSGPPAHASAAAAPDDPDYYVPGSGKAWSGHMEFADPYGRVAVETVGDPVDTRANPFFQPGPNGRACVSCHQPENGMSLSLDTIEKHWAANGAKDPLFAAIDGSNCPSLPQEQEGSHSLLLSRGVFRVGLPWPPRRIDGTVVDPEFKIEVVSDPTGCNTSPIYGLNSPSPTVSVFRRPRMVANMRWLTTPKYDYLAKMVIPIDRDPDTGARVGMDMMADARFPTLKYQALDAAHGHLQYDKPLTPEQIKQIVDFEMRVYVAQNYSKDAGDLTEAGGPKALGVKAMVNGQDHVNAEDIHSGVFFHFDQWKPGGANEGRTPDEKAFRASVARGYDIFFLRPFWIDNAVGINNLPLGNPFKQTCGLCHNTQLTGHDDEPGWIDLGTLNFPKAQEAADLPMFKITCKDSAPPHPFLGRVIFTSDPGRALVSGKCQDVGSVVMQQFRGIGARGPYFANGQAKTLLDVVDFYDRRFNMGLTAQDRQDLANFLSVL